VETTFNQEKLREPSQFKRPEGTTVNRHYPATPLKEAESIVELETVTSPVKHG